MVKGYLQIKFDVLGKPWTLRVLSEKYFKKKNGVCSAISKMHKRRIELRPKYLDHETIVHELVHAYQYEMCLSSTNKISEEDWGEFVAELVAKRGREILDKAEWVANEIANALQAPRV